MQCRLCNNENLIFYYSQGKNNEFKFYKCKNCGLVNYDLSTGLNQTKYGDCYVDPFDNSAKMNISQFQSFRFISSNLKIKGKAFDIGCGNGKLLFLLKNHGWEVKGLELSSLLADSIQTKLNIEVEVADFLTYNQPDLKLYDIVILRHVLEHLPDPVSAMSKINSFLNIGGYAIIEFPNIEAIDLKFKRFLHRNRIFPKYYSDDYKPGHCNEFSKASFSYLASKTGFKIEVFETYSFNSIKNLIYNLIPIGNKIRTIVRKVN